MRHLPRPAVSMLAAVGFASYTITAAVTFSGLSGTSWQAFSAYAAACLTIACLWCIVLRKPDYRAIARMEREVYGETAGRECDRRA